MESMFIKQLKSKGRKELENFRVGESPEARNAIDAYIRLVNTKNLILAMVSVLLGTVSFILMGYLTQIWIKNSSFYSEIFLYALFMGVIVSIILWLFRSATVYAVWTFAIKKEYEGTSLTPFLMLEGISEIAYILIFPLFLITSIVTSAYYAALFIGAGIGIKYLFMWNTYHLFLSEITYSDKALMTAASITSVALFLTLSSMIVF